MTDPETAKRVAAIALELNAIRGRIEDETAHVKTPGAITAEYMEVTTAAYHVFSAIKSLVKLSKDLTPPDEIQLANGAVFEIERAL